MPKRLLERRRRDSIEEFRAAARERLVDGELLAESGRATAAIYLWGYAAEMSLKACYFECIKFDPRAEISPAHRYDAKARAEILGVPWPGRTNYHDLTNWAELLIAERDYRLSPFPMVSKTALLRASKRMRLLWAETLRYSSNKAYDYEVQQAKALVRQITVICSKR